MTQTDTSPELLAPAGDWECLRAAVANGAGAVYFGLANFNARHRAANFTPEELPEVMQFLHDHNVRGYVAFNTLIFSDELAEAARLVECLATAGADAVIVQDLGLARLIHNIAPRLPIHASTQMTLTEPRGIEFLRALGVARVILARELSVEEVGRIAAATSMPLEVFVHGALCIAYSGQCLTSEALGGRSANRGQCAQACRLPYEMIVDGQLRATPERNYLLSPQDLAAYDLVEPLVRLGVQCFKIEGRLKSPEYVAIATRTYRAALEAAVEQREFALAARERVDLEQSFSRGFSPGFLAGANHQVLVPGRFPKSRGVCLGTVIDKTQRGVVVRLTDADGVLVKLGDGIVFDQGHPEQDEQGGRVVDVIPIKRGKSTRGDSQAGEQIELIVRRESVNLAAIELGSLVWRTDDPDMRRRMQQTYARDEVVHRRPLDFELSGALGGAVRLAACDRRGGKVDASWPGPLERSRTQPLTHEIVRGQLGRLGSTPFELGQVQIDLPPDVIVPKSVLNALRREVVEKLLASNEQSRRREIDHRALERLQADAAALRSK